MLPNAHITPDFARVSTPAPIALDSLFRHHCNANILIHCLTLWNENCIFMKKQNDRSYISFKIRNCISFKIIYQLNWSQLHHYWDSIFFQSSPKTSNMSDTIPQQSKCYKGRSLAETFLFAMVLPPPQSVHVLHMSNKRDNMCAYWGALHSSYIVS